MERIERLQWFAAEVIPFATAREPVNGRGDDNIAGASAFISLASCGWSAVVPVIFSRNTFSYPAAFSWRTCPVQSWAAVETRASP
jgi:hypothetical protein